MKLNVQISKRVNKVALFSVEQTLLCFTCKPKCFYWLVVQMLLIPFVFVHGQGTEIENQNI